MNAPPRFATWLLGRLASGADDDAIAGDLQEQYRQGRSAGWFWRQVLSAMLIHTAEDFRAHALVAIGAGAMASLLLFLWAESTWALYLWVSRKWIYELTGRSQILFVVWILYGGGLCLIWCAGSAASGWLSVRLNPRHRAIALFVSVVSQLPWAIWWGVPVFVRGFWSWRFANLAVVGLVVLVGMPTCALLGALAAASDNSERRRILERS